MNPDNPHILIVDDEQEIRELLSRFLQNHGGRTSLAEDGKAMEDTARTTLVSTHA